MEKLKCIIVDDELDSRNILATYLNKYVKQIEIQASCENIQEAKTAIDSLKPDLVFLDIEMPFGNGFDLIEKFENIDFEIIFITAFSQYAIQAFNLSAVHYILKPIDIDELVVAVDKARAKIENKTNLDQTKILLENLNNLGQDSKKVVLPMIDGFEVVRVGEILYCQAEDNFTCFHFTSGKKALICRNLKFYENALNDLGFCRIHRSTLVNLQFVKKYIKGKGGSVILENQKELQVSNSKKQEFLNKFK